MREYIDDLIGEYDAILERLSLAGDFEPLKLMGLKASFALMNSIYTTIATIGFAVLQKLFFG